MEDRIRNSGGRDWQYVAVAAAIVVAGFLLRINQIGQDELWFDEAFSFHMVTLASWPGDLLKYDNPPLYYLLLHAWIQLVGQSESAIRMLSAIFSTLFVVTILWIGRIILGHRAACGVEQCQRSPPSKYTMPKRRGPTRSSRCCWR